MVHISIHATVVVIFVDMKCSLVAAQYAGHIKISRVACVGTDLARWVTLIIKLTICSCRRRMVNIRVT